MAIVEIVPKGAPQTQASRRKNARSGWRFLPTKVALTVANLAILCALILVVTASSAVAQGCTLCYQSAAASGAAGRAALRHGVLILLVPAISLFVGILVLIYRRQNPALREVAEAISSIATLGSGRSHNGGEYSNSGDEAALEEKGWEKPERGRTRLRRVRAG